MLVKRRGRSTYLFNFNLQICFWHCHLGYASNTRVIQASKLVDGINLREKISSEDKLHSFDSKPKVEDNERLNANTKNEFVLINKLSHNPNSIE